MNSFKAVPTDPPPPDFEDEASAPSKNNIRKIIKRNKITSKAATEHCKKQQ